jgi:hypothetical protein
MGSCYLTVQEGRRGDGEYSFVDDRCTNQVGTLVKCRTIREFAILRKVCGANFLPVTLEEWTSFDRTVEEAGLTFSDGKIVFWDMDHLNQVTMWL